MNKRFCRSLRDTRAREHYRLCAHLLSSYEYLVKPVEKKQKKTKKQHLSIAKVRFRVYQIRTTTNNLSHGHLCIRMYAYVSVIRELLVCYPMSSCICVVFQLRLF